MTSPRLSLAVAVKAMIEREGEILVLRRSKQEEVFPVLWDIPGGRMEWGEKPLESLTREVAEETGLQVRIHEPLTVWEFKASESLQVIGITFRATASYGEIRLNDEHDEYRWIEAPDLDALEMKPALREEISQFFAEAKQRE